MRRIRVLSFVEGRSLTGPIRPLLQFADYSAHHPTEPPIEHTLVTTVRGAASAPADNQFLRAARAQGTPCEILPERRALDGSVLRPLRDLLRRLRPDFVESHSFKPHLLFALPGVLDTVSPRPHWIAFHHGYTSENLKVRLYNQFDRWSLRRAERVVTLCQPFADELIHRRGVSPARIEVIKNAVAAAPAIAQEQIESMRQQLGLGRDDRVCLSVGRLSAEKGQIDLVKAFSLLVARHPDWPLRLVLVGDGPERSALQRLGAGLGQRLVFAGQQSNVWPCYALASVFALPSYSEGSPMVLFEAMQSGLPVVATCVGGIPETVSNEREALLVSPRDPGALEQALHRVLSEPRLSARLVSAARLKLQEYTAERYATRLCGVYSGLLQ